MGYGFGVEKQGFEFSLNGERLRVIDASTDATLLVWLRSQGLTKVKVFLESGGQVLRPLVASASVDAGVALDFAGRNGPWRMVIEIMDSKTGKLISPTVARAADIFVGEEEVLIPQGARFRLLGRRWSLWRR